MGQLYVYDPWPEAVDTMGLCGPLTPSKATCTQEKNGDFRLDIEHPIDPAGKWKSLVEFNLIKADVPLRTTPIIPYGEVISTAYASSVGRWTVKPTATSMQRSVYTVPPTYYGVQSPIRLAILPTNTSVYVIGTMDWIGMAWSAIAWPNGRGWIDSAALTFAENRTVSANRGAIEGLIPSPKTRPQLFRIYSVSPSDTGIKAQARHVSYDIAGVLQSVPAGETDFKLAAANALSHKGGVDAHAMVQYFSNATAIKDLAALERIGAIEAVLSPGNSLTATWSTYLLRDNWVYTFLTDPAYASGMSIEYGKNMTGVTANVDTNDMQDAIMPVGQTSKGKPLIVPGDTYIVDGQTVVVSYGIVSSPKYSYPIAHQTVLDLGSSVKAAGTTTAQLNAAYVKLIRAALAKFRDEQCDLPNITMDVSFINLGDTTEYAQYRSLQKVFLYDTVRVKHSRLGIDVTTQVNKTIWDCLLDRYDSIELGSVRKSYARSRLAPWQVPGLTTLRSYVDTISSLI
jgi:phage minor structural protein